MTGKVDFCKLYKLMRKPFEIYTFMCHSYFSCHNYSINGYLPLHTPSSQNTYIPKKYDILKKVNFFNRLSAQTVQCMDYAMNTDLHFGYVLTIIF